MTLSGNLGFVPVDEILRLLTRSQQQGAVEVTGGGIRGRVFVGAGGIDLATTSDDDDLQRHLLNSGYVDDSLLRRVASGETTLAAAAESNSALVELLREMTVESLHQISSRGDDFRVREGRTTPFASPKSFELEALIADATDREKEWAKVSDLVPDLTSPIVFSRDLGGRDDVTVKSDDWRVLSEIGGGASVETIADRLGTTEFWTARVAARLVGNELVEISDTPAEEAAADSEMSPIGDEDHVSYENDTRYDDPYAETAQADAVFESEVVETIQPATEEAYPQDEPVAEKSSDDQPRSWWQEPAASDHDGDEHDPEAPEVVGEGLSEMPTIEAKEDAEEDTEAFLEKVFSELESDEPEAEEGHGLLRRRRMGTLRDFSSDS